MAVKTSTLWENAGDYASFNHCISSYAAVALLRCLLGIKGIKNDEIDMSEDYLKAIDLSVVIDLGDKRIHIKKTRGKITICDKTED